MKAKVFYYVIILFVFSFTNSSAQWNPAGGPEGGNITFIEHVGNELWAGSNAGVYHSSNNGATWSKLLLPIDYCHDVEFFNDTIIVLYQAISTDSLPLYTFYSIRSFDGGWSWSNPSIIESYSSLNNYRSVIYRHQNKLLIKGEWDFYTSDDFGDTWTLMPVPVLTYMYWVFGKDGKYLARFTDSGTADALYYNDDGLQNWVFVDSIHHIQEAILVDSAIIAVSYSTDSVLHEILIRSFDKGISWDTVFEAIPGVGLGSLVEFNGTIYAASYPDFLQSTDLGATWTPKTFPAGFYPYGSVLLANGEMLSFIYSEGILRYDPTQGTLNQSSTGIRATYTNFLFANQNDLYMSSSDSVFKSSDGGMTWNKLPIGFTYNVSFFARGDTIFFANEEYNGGITFSYDNGLTWDTLHAPVGINWSTPTSIEEHNGRVFLSGDKISYSDDWGHTWDTLSALGQSNYNSGYLKEIDSILYIVTNDGYIFKYNDTNATWVYLFNIWSPGSLNGNKLYKLDNKVVMVGQYELIYSSDQGLTWTNSLLYGAPDSSLSGTKSPLNLISSGSIWLGTCGKYGVYYSQDNGDNWNKLPGNSPFYARGGLTFLNSILFSGSYCNSVWRRNGPLNIISGNVFYDANTNGIKDPGEKDLKQIIISTAPTQNFSTTDNAGNYSVYTDAIGDSLFVISPGAFVTVTPDHYTTNGPAINQDFALTIQPGNGDLTINMTNVNVFNPGFLTNISILVSNLGSVDQPGIAAAILDTNLNFISAIPPYDFQNGDTLFWNIDTMTFLDTRNITMTVKTNPNNTTFGDTIICYAHITPGISDLYNYNNTSILFSEVVGSFDPNDKACNHGAYYTPIQLANHEEFEYTIRFQNTGNFAAANVHIRDTLHYYTDPSMFRILSNSHNMRWTLSGNGIIDFYFDNINLPDSGTNELLSHGFVKYAINLKPAAHVGTAITNTAYIYFDFNAPVVTNTTTTTIAYPVVSTVYETLTSIESGIIKVFPNPTSDEMFIDTRGINEEQKDFYIFDLNGKQIEKYAVKGILTHVNTSNLKPGLYIGIVINQNNLQIGSFRFLKQ